MGERQNLLFALATSSLHPPLHFTSSHSPAPASTKEKVRLSRSVRLGEPACISDLRLVAGPRLIRPTFLQCGRSLGRRTRRSSRPSVRRATRRWLQRGRLSLPSTSSTCVRRVRVSYPLRPTRTSHLYRPPASLRNCAAHRSWGVDGVGGPRGVHRAGGARARADELSDRRCVDSACLLQCCPTLAV